MERYIKSIFSTVQNGRNIYSSAEAVLLRALNKEWPGMIKIVETRPYDGDCVDPDRPYFGAILTDKGCSFLALLNT